MKRMRSERCMSMIQLKSKLTKAAFLLLKVNRTHLVHLFLPIIGLNVFVIISDFTELCQS